MKKLKLLSLIILMLTYFLSSAQTQNLSGSYLFMGKGEPKTITTSSKAAINAKTTLYIDTADSKFIVYKSYGNYYNQKWTKLNIEGSGSGGGIKGDKGDKGDIPSTDAHFCNIPSLACNKTSFYACEYLKSWSDDTTYRILC